MMYDVTIMKEDASAKKTTVWFVIGFLVVSTVGAIFAGVASNSFSPKQTAAISLLTTQVAGASDWTQGNKDAKVTIIEYGDFQCPACGAYHPIVKQLMESYGDRVLFIFRNFPLYQVHDDAGIAAQAAEAAGIQGKYWEMYDLIYEKQATWSLLPFGIGVKQYFAGLASSLGLNIDKFNQDMDSDQVKNKIAADVTSGNAAQIDHTPTFFINQKGIENPQSYDDFKSIIDKALASS
jgi:protein-disulfide isomerase